MNNDEIKESLNNLFGYHSPIELIVGEINTQFENDCVTMIQNYGIDINKEELVRALNYDRDQYHKGFQDAKELYEPKKGKWIDGFCNICDCACKSDGWGREIETNFCPSCGADMRGEENGR